MRRSLLSKALATAGSCGLALTEISLQAGTPHSSIHNVLNQLIDEGSAQYVAQTRRYRLRTSSSS